MLVILEVEGDIDEARYMYKMGVACLSARRGVDKTVTMKISIRRSNT